MGHTLAEKILLSPCDADDVVPGDLVMVRCDVVLTNDISGPMAFRAMKKMGVEKVFDPAKVVVVPDHFIPAKDARSAELQKLLAEWAAAQGVAYYGQGRGGIEHTVLVEEGWVVPGSVIAGGDSHTCTYGALGSFGTGLGSTDIAACLATGEFWQAVPGTIQIDLDSLPPLVALPHSPGNIVPVDEARGLAIDQVYVGNCSNGTITDLRQTAEILRGRSVHPRCRMIVVPASQRVYRQALNEGLLDVFVQAGAMVSTPTCGACFGGGSGILAGGERAIATTNRNFRGRMGSPHSE